MVISLEKVKKLYCVTGGIWQCYVYDTDFPDDPIPYNISSVEFCNVGKVENENDDVILTFNRPITCDIDKSDALNCGCPR